MYIVKVLVEHAIYKLDTTIYLNIKFWQVVESISVLVINNL